MCCPRCAADRTQSTPPAATGLQKAVLAFRSAAGECPPPARGEEEEVLEPSTYGALLRGIMVAEDDNPAESLECRLQVADSIRQALEVEQRHHDEVRGQRRPTPRRRGRSRS
jgi:hypothetical protein